MCSSDLDMEPLLPEFIVAQHIHFCAKLFHQMGKVVGEGVVIVYDNCFHLFIYNLFYLLFDDLRCTIEVTLFTMYDLAAQCTPHGKSYIVNRQIVHKLTFFLPSQSPFSVRRVCCSPLAVRTRRCSWLRCRRLPGTRGHHCG